MIHVRSGSLADTRPDLSRVCLTPESGHGTERKRVRLGPITDIRTSLYASERRNAYLLYGQSRLKSSQVSKRSVLDNKGSVLGNDE